MRLSFYTTSPLEGITRLKDFMQSQCRYYIQDIVKYQDELDQLAEHIDEYEDCVLFSSLDYIGSKVTKLFETVFLELGYEDGITEEVRAVFTCYCKLKNGSYSEFTGMHEAAVREIFSNLYAKTDLELQCNILCHRLGRINNLTTIEQTTLLEKLSKFFGVSVSIEVLSNIDAVWNDTANISYDMLEDLYLYLDSLIDTNKLTNAEDNGLLLEAVLENLPEVFKGKYASIHSYEQLMDVKDSLIEDCCDFIMRPEAEEGGYEEVCAASVIYILCKGKLPNTDDIESEEDAVEFINSVFDLVNS